ncbi:hypothetical protein BOX15_Mlig005321g1 [Macrostomum lignano]|uniref:RING-type domain-containing protein n=1 Tax=Macrostomum lignano TaxID=282301 RepID=A0A267ECK6_9PLAT|nr:hypothetical protein BOX15_Mlig005321g1 [Macrostomum lignano]
MSKARQDLEDRVTCPVCLEHFVDPRHLSQCNHTVCLRCYARMLAGVPEGVRCPLGCPGVCDKRPEDLAPNRTMLDLLEQANRAHLLAVARPNGAACQRSGCSRASHGRCEHCDADLCSRHLLEDAYLYGNACESLCQTTRRLADEAEAAWRRMLAGQEARRGRLSELQTACRELLTLARDADAAAEGRAKSALSAAQSEADRRREARSLADQLERETAEGNTAEMRRLAERLQPLLDRLRTRRLAGEADARAEAATSEALERLGEACAELRRLAAPLARRLSSCDAAGGACGGGGGGGAAGGDAGVRWPPKKIFHYRCTDAAVVVHSGRGLVCRPGLAGIRIATEMELTDGQGGDSGWEPLPSPVVYLLAQGGSVIKVLSCSGRSLTSLQLDSSSSAVADAAIASTTVGSLTCLLYIGGPDQLLAAADGGRVYLADLAGRLRHAIADVGRPSGLCADASRRRLFVADSDRRSIAVLSLETRVHQIVIDVVPFAQSLGASAFLMVDCF